MTATDLEREAQSLQADQLADWLRHHLGQQLAAFALYAAAEHTLGPGAARTGRMSDVAVARMRAAYEAARLIVDAHGDATARSWFLGVNPHLDEHAPALVLREAGDPADMSSVPAAARAFVAGEFS